MPRKPDTGNMPELLTTKQVSAWLGIPKEELYRKSLTTIPGRITFRPRTTRWDRAVLLAWLEENRVVLAPEANGDKQEA